MKILMERNTIKNSSGAILALQSPFQINAEDNNRTVIGVSIKHKWPAKLGLIMCLSLSSLSFRKS
jgi:hypothetical protein